MRIHHGDQLSMLKEYFTDMNFTEITNLLFNIDPNNLIRIEQQLTFIKLKPQITKNDMYCPLSSEEFKPDSNTSVQYQKCFNSYNDYEKNNNENIISFEEDPFSLFVRKLIMENHSFKYIDPNYDSCSIFKENEERIINEEIQIRINKSPVKPLVQTFIDENNNKNIQIKYRGNKRFKKRLFKNLKEEQINSFALFNKNKNPPLPTVLEEANVNVIEGEENIQVFKKSSGNIKRFKPELKNTKKGKIATKQISTQIQNDLINTNEVNSPKEIDNSQKFPKFCIKNFYLRTFNIEEVHKTKPLIKFMKDDKLIHDNFMDINCYEICGKSLICPELLPLNCSRYMNKECVCLDRCKEKDAVYKAFIAANNINSSDLEF
jgi:hypothetical protein